MHHNILFLLFFFSEKPSEPSIEMPTSTPKEGDQVTYRCSSTGRPAPKLTLSYGGTSVPEGEIQHLPTVDSITLDSPETTTVLTWTTSAKKQMNKKSLMCEVYDHPTTERRLSSRTMTVYCKLTNGKETTSRAICC